MPLSLPSRFVLILSGCLTALLAVGTRGLASTEGFVPLTVENVSDIELLFTIEDYSDSDSFCACDVRSFSQNGRAIATDRKVVDLTTGNTLDFTGRGYPLALYPDGTQVLVSGQDKGTRLVEIATGTEHPLMAGDAENAVFSPDGALIATTSLDTDAIQIWQAESLELLTTLGQSKVVADTRGLKFTEDSHYLIWSDQNDNLNLWDVEAQTGSWQIAPNTWGYKLAADQRTLMLLKYDFKTLEVWDLETREMVAQVEDTRDQSGVENYAISPDRRTLAIKYFGGNARLELWNITTQPAKKLVELDEQDGYALNFSPDSRYLIFSGDYMPDICDREANSCFSSSGNSSDAILMIDVASGEVVNRVIPPDGSRVYTTSLIDDGQLLITSSYFGSDGFQLWQRDGSELTPSANLPGGDVQVSPDETTILATINNHFLAVYGVPTQSRPVRQFVIPGRIVPSSINVRSEPDTAADTIGVASGDVRIMGRNEAGDYVYLPDYEGWIHADPTYLRLGIDISVNSLSVVNPAVLTAQVVESTPTITPLSTSTPQPWIEIAIPLENLQLPVNEVILQPVVPPTGLIPISPDNVKDVLLLAILPHSFLRIHELPLLVPSISLDGMRLITPPVDEQTHPRIWDLQTFEYQNGPETGKPEFSVVMVASPDGEHIAFTPDDFYEPLKLWSVENRVSKTLLNIHVPLGISLAFSPDGKYLAYPGGVFDVAAHDIRFTVENSGSVVFSSDGARMAVVARERVYLYDVETGELFARTPRVVRPNYDNVLAAKFSPDNMTLVTTSSDGIAVYDVVTGEALYSISVSTSYHWAIGNVVFSPDAETLTAINSQGILQVWDARAGASLGIYETNGAKGIAISPDGQLLAIGNPLRLIDLRSGEITTVPGNYGGSQIMFSPDGSSLLIDSADNFYNDLQSVMVLGIPTSERPAWQPVVAHVTASAINVRAEPEGDAPTVGTVSGEVRILGRDTSGEALYLADPAGWVWSAPEYLDLGSISLDTLPVVTSSQVPAS